MLILIQPEVFLSRVNRAAMKLKKKIYIERSASETGSLIFIQKLYAKVQKGIYSKQGTSPLVYLLLLLSKRNYCPTAPVANRII